MCSSAIGAGDGVPTAIASAVEAMVPSLERQFHLCAFTPMAWQPNTGVFEQRIFTPDGDDAALVAWEREGDWVVTFISADDGAAYQEVSAELDWRVLGRPHPFMRCDGLWMQAFEGQDGRLVGVGLRRGEDIENHPNRPLFVWGAAVEVLLTEAGALQLPAASPTADAIGTLQYFFDRREPVRAPPTSAGNLTVRDIRDHCDP